MKADHIDILIIGAGLSGIGAAYHLQQKCPGRAFAILEARDRIGGTWDLFRYPGVRSDSDMFTLGYSFRPWTARKSIADGHSILDYLRDTAREHGIDRKVRFDHRVKRASWSSQEVRWTVEAERGAARELVYITCNFLIVCSGYYSYAEGYTPALPGISRFKGQIIHPQDWTDDVVYANKRVVVIGSGATAVTLVPELAKAATHVTMLQRSPSYVVAWPDEDRIANVLRRWLPAKLACSITRWKNVLAGMYFYRICKRDPERAKTMIRDGLRAELGPDYDIAKHFTPRYNPWDQRLCLAPNGDFFHSIRSGKTTIVTDEIETFTETGLKLRSGQELEADLVVTATGLNLQVLGGAEIDVDGKPTDSADHAQLQRGDVQRHPQPCVRVRLHQRVVDPEGGAHLRLRLPSAQPHGEARLHQVHAAQHGSHDRAPARGRLLLGLFPARDGQAAETGVAQAVADLPELCRRTRSPCGSRPSRTACWSSRRSPRCVTARQRRAPAGPWKVPERGPRIAD